MRTGDYWKSRFELIEQAGHRKGVECYAEIEQQYREAQKSVEQQIAAWYQRFAKNNEISMTEARKLLSERELKEFKWDVKDYIRYGEENALNGQWVKELENASARYHISRLEALQLQLQQQIEVAFGNQLDSLDKSMREIYMDGYYHTTFEIQKGAGVGWDFATLDQKRIDKIINKPWAQDGKNFSSRVWTNKQKLVQELNTTLTQGIILGKDPSKVISQMSERLRVSKAVAGRLVMTESAAFASAAQKDCFKELDVEKYQILATLDSRTSAICQEMDGKVFKMSEWEVGVTAPPFHVWCRTTTIPYFDDWEEFGITPERAARGEDGKTYYVPADMTYKEWQKSFVDGDKTGLQEVTPDVKEMSIEEIQKQISVNNSQIETLASEYSQKQQALENALLFGDLDVDTLNKMSADAQSVKASLDDIMQKNDVLKGLLPTETVQAIQSKVVQGKNLVNEIDYQGSDLEYVIEKAMHAQGFDGLPSVVEYEDFKKAMEESNFYAERTYSAQTQELLDQYRDELYHGKWYVDCSTGGSQYGQGMYCASCYDLSDGKSKGGIGWEMTHYQQIGVGRGNAFSYVEGITLQPDAKVLVLPNSAKVEEYISDLYRHEYLKKYATSEQLAQVNRYIEYDLKIQQNTTSDSMDFIDSLYQERAKATVGIEQLIQDAFTAMEDTTDGKKYHGLKNPGALAVEMGYDVIKAEGHGESGSYSVILNRTKVIFCKGGSIYDN